MWPGAGAGAVECARLLIGRRGRGAEVGRESVARLVVAGAGMAGKRRGVWVVLVGGSCGGENVEGTKWLAGWWAGGLGWAGLVRWRWKGDYLLLRIGGQSKPIIAPTTYRARPTRCIYYCGDKYVLTYVLRYRKHIPGSSRRRFLQKTPIRGSRAFLSRSAGELYVPHTSASMSTSTVAPSL